jgi:hypothetical protein
MSLLKNKFPQSAPAFTRLIKLEEDNMTLTAELAEVKEVLFITTLKLMHIRK